MDVGESDSQSLKTPPQSPDPGTASSPPPLPAEASTAREVEVTVASVTVVPADSASNVSIAPVPIPESAPGLSADSLPTSTGDDSRGHSATAVAGPVVASGGWVPRSVLAWFIVLVSLLFLIASFCRFLDGVIAGKVPFNQPGEILVYLLPTAIPALVLGLIGSLMGWATLLALRRALGQRRGLFAGLVAALSWPLLLLTIFGLLMPAGMLSSYLNRQGNDVGPSLMLGALALSVVFDLGLFMGFSRWSASVKKAKAALAPGATLVIRHRPTLVAVGAFLHFAATIVLGFTSIAYVGNRAQEERNRPMPGFEETNVPPPPEVVPEPPPEVRAPRPRVAVNLESQIKPGGSTRSQQVLFPRKGQLASLRMTFWSNGVPVDLPGLSFESPFANASDNGVQAEWELKRADDGSHYTLSAPRLNPTTQESPSGQAAFEIPGDIQLVPVPSGDQAVALRAIGPTRRWLFLSVRDAQMGAKLNAEWGVSLDFAMPANP